MKDIEEANIEALSISKRIWKLETSEDGMKAVEDASLSPGDCVRVSLIIECGQDLDYVALKDERAACLEPSSQLSGYAMIDGLWCYRETGNSATGFFFETLPRGRHIVSYDAVIVEAGEFASGIATIQSLFAPLITAHSGGDVLKVQ